MEVIIMKKTMKTLLAMVMAVILVFSAIPVSAASVGENFDALVSHIKNHPQSFVNDDGNRMFGYVIDVGVGTATLTLEAKSTGIMFALYMEAAEEGQQVQTWVEFLLRKNYYTVNSDFYALLLENGEAIDYIEDSVSFDRRKHTADSEYQISGSEYGQVSAEDASMTYTMALQTSCMFWNTYFLNNLGFGLDGLGFTKYECPHTYTNDCDAQCDLCGQITRETEHSFGAWVKADEDNHSKTCTVCGEKETEAHKWSVKEIVKMPTEEENGLITYVCNGCGAEKTVDVVYKPGDLEVDGFVDNKDVEYLLWHTLYPEDYPLPGNGDFDDSDSIDNKDVEYLLWHTLFPEDYPLV